MSVFGYIHFPIGDHPRKFDAELARKDIYPLLYSATMCISKNKDAKYNAQGFGAAGFPPLAFSHISRNWKNAAQPKKNYVSSSCRDVGELYVIMQKLMY